MRTNCIGITIYNKYIDASTRSELYHRTQIRLVTWENRRAANKSSAGEIANNAATVYIPYTRAANYLDPHAWQDLVSKIGKWTIQEGDIIVRGLVSDEISSSFTVTDLKETYNDVMTVASVDFMDLGSPAITHWQIETR